MKKEGALSKIGESEIVNQWFKWVKMTIVPRPSQDRSKVYAWGTQWRRAEPYTTLGEELNTGEGFATTLGEELREKEELGEGLIGCGG